jgi:hypothetical protein
VFVEARDGQPFQKCYGCGLTKAASDFAWRRKARNQRDTYCRPCRSAYKAEHYRKNKARYIENARVRSDRERLRRTMYLLDYFRFHPCADCGESEPLVLEFDHLADKSFEIGTNFADRGWESILAEMAKCDVVCANCHRIRTAARRGSLRYRISRGPDTEEESG